MGGQHQPRLSARVHTRRLRQRLLGLAGAVVTAAGLAGVAMPWSSPLHPAAVHADSTFDTDMFALINQDRTNNGLPPLQQSTQLGNIGENATYNGCGYPVAGRAEDLIARNYFSHTILNCGSQTVFNILQADGVAQNGAGENIGWAAGFTDPASAAKWINDQFMQSSEHVHNILSTSFTTVGIGSWWTASGQTWSGAGSTQSDVVVVAEEFITAPQAPASAGPPAPAAHRAPPPLPVTGAHPLPAPASPASTSSGGATLAAAAAPAAAVVLTVAAPGGDDSRLPHSAGRPLFDAGVWHVPAQAGSNTPTAAGMSLAMTCGGVILGVLALMRPPLSRARRRRRRHGRALG